jgi:3-oxoacyl-[acyl-carrier protein] reductase
MDLQLKNRVALVTGGSKGVGAAITKSLAKEGVRVAFCARASRELNELSAELTAAGLTVAAMEIDALKPSGIPALVEAVVAKWGSLDILVNNLGGAPKMGSFEELSDDDWVGSFEFNVMSVVRFTRASLPHLRRSELRRIINISSISGLQPGYYNPHYTTTKAAVVNLGKQLANSLAKDRILVNTVCPGPVHSDSWNRNVSQVATARGTTFEAAYDFIESAEAAKIPLGVVGEAEQVASAVALLASPLSAWTTGSCVHINGGKLAAAI